MRPAAAGRSPAADRRRPSAAGRSPAALCADADYESAEEPVRPRLVRRRLAAVLEGLNVAVLAAARRAPEAIKRLRAELLFESPQG
eukprot:6525619-Heterocapsa_arctica.AAC.1